MRTLLRAALPAAEGVPLPFGSPEASQLLITCRLTTSEAAAIRRSDIPVHALTGSHNGITAATAVAALAGSLGAHSMHSMHGGHAGGWVAGRYG